MVLSIKEFSKKRKTSEAIVWADLEINRIGLLNLGTSKIFLKKERAIKILLEEYLPLAIYAKKYFGDQDYFCCLTIDGSPVDGLITQKVGNVVETIQITQASLNYQERLRNELRVKNGIVFSTSEVEVEKRGNNRIITEKRSFRNRKGLIDDCTIDCVKAINIKMTKFYESIDTLLVGYDFKVHSKLNESLNEVVSGVELKINRDRSKFKKIYLVEISGDVRLVK